MHNSPLPHILMSIGEIPVSDEYDLEVAAVMSVSQRIGERCTMLIV